MSVSVCELMRNFNLRYVGIVLLALVFCLKVSGGNRTIKLNAVIPVSAQINKTNTTYIVKNNLNLGGDTVVVPEGCKIVIKKGIVSNGLIIGNNTTIEASANLCFSNDLSLGGTWYDTLPCPEWFGAKGNGESDDTECIQKAAIVAANGSLMFTKGRSYLYTKPVVLRSHTKVIGYGATIVKACYSAFLKNENANYDKEDSDIGIYGLRCVSKDDAYRGLWLWLLGVNGLTINDCHFENHTPIDDNGLSQWCMTLSGEDISITGCSINTMGGGLYSDGIHVYYAKNCTISNCRIDTEDDCISFTPEVPNSEKGFEKYNRLSENIKVCDNKLHSERNCIRFEIRNNAPALFSYSNVTIENIEMRCSQTEKGGSALLIHDYRENTANKSTNFNVSNISIEGGNVGDGRNCIEIFGEHPEKIPENVCNISGIRLQNVHCGKGAYDNYIRMIGVEDVTVENCAFSANEGKHCAISIRNCKDINIYNNEFDTFTPYSFVSINNSDCIIEKNIVRRISNTKGAGTGILIDAVSYVTLQANEFYNFAHGVNAKNASNLKLNENRFEDVERYLKLGD